MSGTYDLHALPRGLATTADFYVSSPLHFLPDLDGGDLERLRTRFILLASGEGRAEDIGESWRVAHLLGSKGIPNRVDSWGAEWHHDWPTWRHMLPQYLGRAGRLETPRWHDRRSTAEFDGERRREFMRALLRDLRALERMLAEGMIEEGVRRIGAEQEMFLVDRDLAAGAGGAADARARSTTRTSRPSSAPFNLEVNLDPQRLRRRLPRAAWSASSTSWLEQLRARGRAELGYERRADRHPADDPQVRPRPREHDAEPALPRAQPAR